MVTFENITYLSGLLLLPVLAGINLHYLKWQKARRADFGYPLFSEHLFLGGSIYRRRVKTWLLFFVFALLIIALANPQRNIQQLKAHTSAPDVVFAIDISASMLTEDVLPNRILKAKSLALQILDHLQGEEIGIVIFAGKAYPYLPLTTDYLEVRNHIKRINVDMDIRQGTSLEDALQVAGLMFMHDEKGPKTICLISDGESHTQQYKKVADSLRKDGVNIVCAGVGTASGGHIPFRKKGDAVVSRLNNKSLFTLVNGDAKRYYALDGQPADLSSFLSALKDHPNQKPVYTPVMKSLFEFFLWLAMCLLLVEMMLPFKTTDNNNVKNNNK